MVLSSPFRYAHEVIGDDTENFAELHWDEKYLGKIVDLHNNEYIQNVDRDLKTKETTYTPVSTNYIILLTQETYPQSLYSLQETEYNGSQRKKG